MAVVVGSVTISTTLDTQEAQGDLEALKDELYYGLGRAAEKGGAEFEKALEKYTKRAQKNIQSFGQKAGFDIQSAFKELPGLAGDAGDALGMLNERMGFLTKNQEEAASSVLSLTEKIWTDGQHHRRPMGCCGWRWYRPRGGHRR
jgi:hypothetical protein